MSIHSIAVTSESAYDVIRLRDSATATGLLTATEQTEIIYTANYESFFVHLVSGNSGATGGFICQIQGSIDGTNFQSLATATAIGTQSNPGQNGFPFRVPFVRILMASSASATDILCSPVLVGLRR